MKLLGISRYGGEKSVQFLRQLSLHTGLWLLRRMLVPRDGNGARSRPLNNGQFYHWEWIMSPLSLSLSGEDQAGEQGKISCVEGIYEEVAARAELSTKVRLGHGSLPLPCYLIVLLVRRDAPSWSRFSPPLPSRPSLPFATALAPFSCFVIAASSFPCPSPPPPLPGPLDPFLLRSARLATTVFPALNTRAYELCVIKNLLLRSMEREDTSISSKRNEREKTRSFFFLFLSFPPPS